MQSDWTTRHTVAHCKCTVQQETCKVNEIHTMKTIERTGETPAKTS